MNDSALAMYFSNQFLGPANKHQQSQQYRQAGENYRFFGMPSVHDVAKFILRERGEMTAMKLHKLLYYAQAWTLVWDEKPLFPQPIEAWANGPVVPAVYALHRGKFTVSDWPKGSVNNLTENQKKHVKSVLRFYGGKTGQWLSELTHRELPWAEARKNLAPSARGNSEITPAAMHEYYGSL